MHLAVRDRPAPGCTPTRHARSRGRCPCAAFSLKCSTVSARPVGVDAAHPGEVVERPGLLQPAALEQLLREATRAATAGGRSACGSDRRRSASTARPGWSCRARTSPCRPPCTSSTRSRTAARRRRRRSCGAAGGPGRASTGRTFRSGVTAATTPRPSGRSGRRAAWRSAMRLAGVAGVGHRPLAPGSAGRRRTRRASRGCGRSRRPPAARPGGPGRDRRARRGRCARRRRGRPRRSGRRAAPRSRPGSRGRARSASIWPISDAPFVSSACRRALAA